MAWFWLNTNLIWAKKTLIKTLTIQPYIWYNYEAFSMLYTIPAYCSIFQHFVQTSGISSFLRHIVDLSVNQFSHSIWSFGAIPNPSGMMPELIAQSPIFSPSTNPPGQCPIFDMILFSTQLTFDGSSPWSKYFLYHLS